MTALYAIHPGMTARLLDGGTAAVVDVVIHPTRQMEPLLVLRVDPLLGPTVVASYTVVSHVDGWVHLTMSTHEARALPAFDPLRHRRDQLVLEEDDGLYPTG